MDTEWLSVLDGAGDVGVGHTAYGGGLDFVLELPPFDDVFTLHSRGPQQLRCLDAKHPAECPLYVAKGGMGAWDLRWLLPSRKRLTPAPTGARPPPAGTGTASTS